MKNVVFLLFDLLAALAKPLRPGGARAVIAENLLLKRQQINLAFGLDLDKDTVQRILAAYYKHGPGDRGPSWLTTLGRGKDSLWSIDLFRAQSITLKTHWIMVVMDQCARRIVGFAVHTGDIDGSALCRLFSNATTGQGRPKCSSTDNAPIFQYHRWKADLRILEIEEFKSLPFVPMSHPFVERLIGSFRRELLDQTFFWTASTPNSED